MKVVISRPAQIDLLEIETWIARDKPKTAARIGDALYEPCLSLGHKPDRYPLAPELGLRRRVVRRWLIFYRVSDHVEIVRIVDGARDWLRLLRSED